MNSHPNQQHIPPKNSTVPGRGGRWRFAFLVFLKKRCNFAVTIKKKTNSATQIQHSCDEKNTTYTYCKHSACGSGNDCLHRGISTYNLFP